MFGPDSASVIVPPTNSNHNRTELASPNAQFGSIDFSDRSRIGKRLVVFQITNVVTDQRGIWCYK
jgi:hypothetical protein